MPRIRVNFLSLPARIYCLTIATVAAIVIAVGLAFWSEYHNEHRAVWQRNEAILFTLDRFVQSQLSSAAGLLWAVARSAVDPINQADGDILTLSRHVTQAMPSLRTLLLVDATGTIVFDSRPDAAALGLNVSDRHYFARHLDEGSNGLVIDNPVRSRIDGAWALPLSIAISDETGALRYVVAGSLALDDLEGVLGYVGGNLVTSILVARYEGDDGGVMARWPHDEDLIGASVADTYLINRAIKDAPSGRYEAASPFDGADLVISYQIVSPFPVVVAVGQEADRVWHVVWGRVWPWMLVAGWVVAAIGYVGVRLASQVRKTEQEKARAEMADHRKSEFLATMSHEMRTPLNAISGFSELLQLDAGSGSLSERQCAYLGHIGSSAGLLRALVDDVLDLSALLEGAVTVDEVDIPVGELMEAAATMVADSARQQHIRLVVESPERSASWHLTGDRRRLLQVLINLLSNAIKFAPADSVVSLGITDLNPSTMGLYVRDQGPGIAAADLHRVMEPFARLGDAHVRSAEGAGLGLPISNQIAKMHGGDLVIDSASGKGTTVTLSLPRSRFRTETGSLPIPALLAG